MFSRQRVESWETTEDSQCDSRGRVDDDDKNEKNEMLRRMMETRGEEGDTAVGKAGCCLEGKMNARVYREREDPAGWKEVWGKGLRERLGTRSGFVAGEGQRARTRGMEGRGREMGA